MAALFTTGCAPWLRVVAAGDLNLGATGGAVLAPLSGVLRGDVRLCNLEGPLVDECATHGETLCAPTERARVLRGSIDVAGLENNHADDAGPRGRVSTIAALRRVGVVAAEKTATIVRRGRTITILSRALAPGAMPDEELLAAVRATRGLRIVNLHWGETGMLQPSAAQRASARALIDAGALAVIGHGPHSVQPVEAYRGGVIAYSLGNLAFECDCTTERDGVILDFAIDRRGRVHDIALVPIEVGLHGAASRPSQDREHWKLIEELHAGIGVRLVRMASYRDRLFVSPTRGD